MPTEVYEDTDAFTTEWDQDLAAVVHTWKEYVDGDLFRDGANAMTAATKRYGGSKILIDHRNMKLVDQADQEFIRQEWVPQAVEAGANYHVVVHQESTIAEMNLDGVLGVEGYDYETEMTSDIDDARAWLDQW